MTSCWGSDRNASPKTIGGSQDGATLVEAPVEMTEPTGAETIVLLRLAGHDVLGRVAPDIKLQPGERRTLRLGHA